MNEIGTLQELNVKPGDVVEVIGGRQFLVKGIDAKGVYCFDKVAPYLSNTLEFRIISRVAPEPKLWCVTSESKRVTVPLMADFKEIGTIDLVDGKPDFASIKLDDAEGVPNRTGTLHFHGV